VDVKIPNLLILRFYILDAFNFVMFPNTRAEQTRGCGRVHYGVSWWLVD